MFWLPGVLGADVSLISSSGRSQVSHVGMYIHCGLYWKICC